MVFKSFVKSWQRFCSGPEIRNWQSSQLSQSKCPLSLMDGLKWNILALAGGSFLDRMEDEKSINDHEMNKTWIITLNCGFKWLHEHKLMNFMNWTVSHKGIGVKGNWKTLIRSNLWSTATPKICQTNIFPARQIFLFSCASKNVKFLLSWLVSLICVCLRYTLR